LKEKNIYIISGCNGAGKTTASYTILPEILNCKEFVNADNIALGLSPFQPEKVAFEAGRIMLERIDTLLKRNESFAFETTLATKSYKQRLLKAKEDGYTVKLLFFWLPSIEMAITRVAIRVSEGGHNIPKEVIARRYSRGIENLFKIYIPLCDSFLILDTEEEPKVIATGTINQKIEIMNEFKWKLINSTNE
jgi:predicted ABC-type ATPase